VNGVKDERWWDFDALCKVLQREVNSLKRELASWGGTKDLEGVWEGLSVLEQVIAKLRAGDSNLDEEERRAVSFSLRTVGFGTAFRTQEVREAVIQADLLGAWAVHGE
jgi:hypothetical protein